MGTIKLLLTQPISRQQLMLSKIAVMWFYNVLFMLVVAIFALVPAVMIFGTGDVMVFNNGLQFLLEASFGWRYGLAVVFAVLGMTAFSSLAMYCAIYFKNTLTAILVSFGILILHTLFQSFTFEVTSVWQNLLVTYHMSNWQQLFVTDVPWNEILISVSFLCIFTLVFCMLSVMKFNRLNITE